MKRRVAFILSLVMISVLTGCKGTGNAGKDSSQTESSGAGNTAGAVSEKNAEALKGITIGTGSAGGTSEIVGATMAEIWKKAVSDMDFTAIPTSGSQANVSLLQNNDVQFSITTAEAAVSGREGSAPFQTPYEDLRSVCALFPNTLQIWANKDADIKDFKDLESKKFCFGMPGGGPYQVTLNLMELYGMSQDSVKAAGGEIIQLAWGEAVNALQDGNLDAVIWTTSFPAANIVNASMTKEYDLVQMDMGKIEEYIDGHKGWAKQIIPAGTYAGQEEDVTTIATYNILCTDQKLSEDLVYELTKALCTNYDSLANSHSMMAGISDDNIASGLGIPLHEGAKGFYDEAGISYEDN
ncbi:TAXI family TRAP transporter solute-binding subunit [Clostridium sp. AM58-1XD]|uniref:TAXI family TRAP transporter solute-binding subunit n=1 Tax=Clostridium sp. AM58-1XD TaxID=2292307 RepID=UPI000E4A90F2|nr:TAXI family TRAP transporter solute-binding subunit [Clostridium sp. AM58-1XD]RGY97716.1 hypothetical protein DXA13_13610 [Clostridium sp. AM58-1XD]